MKLTVLLISISLFLLSPVAYGHHAHGHQDTQLDQCQN
jgi:hypothetical protein